MLQSHVVCRVILGGARLLHPRVREHLLGCGPLTGILDERHLDEVFGLGADFRPFAFREHQRHGPNRLVDGLLRVAAEGRPARQHDEDDDTGGPDVHFVIVLFALNHFWRHIHRAA